LNPTRLEYIKEEFNKQKNPKYKFNVGGPGGANYYIYNLKTAPSVCLMN